MIPLPPGPTRTYTLLPYTTLFRSAGASGKQQRQGGGTDSRETRVVHGHAPWSGKGKERDTASLRVDCAATSADGRGTVVAFEAGPERSSGRVRGPEALPRQRRVIVSTGPGGAGGARRTGLSFLPEPADRSEEHTSELQSLMRISSAVFCLKKKTTKQMTTRSQP